MHDREVIKPSVNKCLKCGLEFRFKGSLSRHLRSLHNIMIENMKLFLEGRVCFISMPSVMGSFLILATCKRIVKMRVRRLL
jgi:hypothetical protein